MFGMKSADVLDAEPESNPKLLAAIDKEVHKAQADADEVRVALERLESEAGDLEGAKHEADAAQAELDEIEAGALLGAADESARRQAVAALSKARNKAQKAQEEASRREAGARGLRRKHESLGGRLEALTRKRAEVALLVHWDEIEKAEKRLVDLLQGEELAAIMRELNTCVRNYGKARKALNDDARMPEAKKLTIELPTLWAHPERRRLTGRDAAGVLRI